MSPRPIRWLWRLCNLAAEPGIRIASRLNPSLRYKPRATTAVCYAFHVLPLRAVALSLCCALLPALAQIASMATVWIVVIGAAAVLTATTAVVIEELHTARRRDVPHCPYCLEGYGNGGDGPGGWPDDDPEPDGGLIRDLIVFDETAIADEYRDLCDRDRAAASP